MDISKCLKLFLISVFLFLIGCKRDEYFMSEKSFDRIFVENWIDYKKPRKIVLEQQEENTVDIKNKTITSFEVFVEVANDTYTLFVTPKSIWKGKLTKNLLLKIDDSIVFEMTDIKTSLDTLKKTFTLGREFHVYNSIDSLNVNGNKLINESSDILLSMDIAEINHE